MTREEVARIKELYEKLASSPLGMSTAWERKASAGKPLLYGGKRGLLAYGTIATWDEFDLIVAIVNALPAILALTPSHEAGTQRNVAHEDCLNCHCSDESLCAGTEPRSRKMVPEIPFDPMDHHNALLCPYCNPQGLKFAESGTQDARVPKVRTNHHRNKEEAARLQALVTERYARDGAGTQEQNKDSNASANGSFRKLFSFPRSQNRKRGTSVMGELTFGAFLRRSRERDGDSLSQAAEQIGCTKAHLWDMENGNSQNPSIKILAGIARAYDLDLGEVAVVAAGSCPGSGFGPVRSRHVGRASGT